MRKHKRGETFEDQRGKWNKKHFDNKDEEIAYLKTQVEYLKNSIQIFIAEYITFYNNERFQKKNGDRSPVEYRESIAA